MTRVVVVGPHPDDQELGMGGAIRRFAEQGDAVLLLDVTDGEPTPMGDHDTRQGEAAAALDVLNAGLDDIDGSVPVRRMLLGLPNREVVHTVEARRAVAAVYRAWQAEVVFTPYFEDAHPDHLAVTRIAEDARFDAKLSKLSFPQPVDGWTGSPLDGPGVTAGGETEPVHPKWVFYYYATHLRWVADPSFVLDVTGAMATKLDAIRAYRTQFVLPEKNRKVLGWVEAAATYFGSRIGTEAGEPFFTKEPVGLGGLGALV